MTWDTGHPQGSAPDASAPALAIGVPALYRPEPSERPHIDRPEALRYLGYGGQQIEPELTRAIESIMREVERTIEPRGVRMVFPVDAAATDASGEPCIRTVGAAIELRGRDIYRHLKDASHVCVLACTLGMACERRLRLLSSQHPLDATIYDAAASAYVEAAVREMDAQARAEAEAAGLASNWRFSPGYGDCPLAAQPQILAALNARRLIGLTATPTNLLMPTKSVTAVIGLFEGDVHDADTRPTCSICRMRASCRFRARGETCYGAR